LDISDHTSNLVNEYLAIPFDYVITVCDNANEACPYFPGSVKRFYYNFPDPAKAVGTHEEVMNEFRKVRDMIKAYTRNFVSSYVSR
jgi:arsenate reductase